MKNEKTQQIHHLFKKKTENTECEILQKTFPSIKNILTKETNNNLLKPLYFGKPLIFEWQINIESLTFKGYHQSPIFTHYETNTRWALLWSQSTYDEFTKNNNERILLHPQQQQQQQQQKKTESEFSILLLNAPANIDFCLVFKKLQCLETGNVINYGCRPSLVKHDLVSMFNDSRNLGFTNDIFRNYKTITLKVSIDITYIKYGVFFFSFFLSFLK